MKKKALQIFLIIIGIIALCLCFFQGTIDPRNSRLEVIPAAASALGMGIAAGLSLIALAIISKNEK